MELTKEYFDSKMKHLDSKMEKFVTKEHLGQEINSLEDRLSQKFATKDDLKNFITKDDLKNFVTKDDLKTQLGILRQEVNNDIENAVNNLSDHIHETVVIPLTRHLEQAQANNEAWLVKDQTRRQRSK